MASIACLSCGEPGPLSPQGLPADLPGGIRQPPAASTAGLSLTAIPVVEVAGTGPWKEVDADYRYSCALKSDRTLWCWGVNIGGKLGDGTTKDRHAPVFVVGVNDWVRFSMADHLTCGIRDDQSLWCWGSQVKSVSAPTHPKPTNLEPQRIPVPGAGEIPPSNSKGLVGMEAAPSVPLLDVGLGDSHTCVLTVQNEIYCLGDSAKAGSAFPIWAFYVWHRIDLSLAGASARFRDITVGSKHTCAISSLDQVLCWGLNPKGQTGTGEFAPEVPIPTPIDLSLVSGNKAVRQLAAGVFHTCAIFQDGELFCWGDNENGCLGLGDSADRAIPTPVRLKGALGEVKWVQVDGGFHSTCLLSDKGDIYCFGAGYCPQVFAPPNIPCGPTPVSGPSIDGKEPYRQLAVGTGHACAISVSDRLFCWGTDSGGALGGGFEPDNDPSAGAK